MCPVPSAIKQCFNIWTHYQDSFILLILPFEQPRPVCGWQRANSKPHFFYLSDLKLYLYPDLFSDTWSSWFTYSLFWVKTWLNSGQFSLRQIFSARLWLKITPQFKISYKCSIQAVHELLCGESDCSPVNVLSGELHLKLWGAAYGAHENCSTCS